MLRNLLDKGKCALGYHVEAWQYVGTRMCRQTSRCARCGVVSERTAHAWGGWTRVDETSCTATRTCSRCRQDENREDHDWSAWSYDEPGACRQRVHCSRCAEPGTSTRLLHDRDEWHWSDFYVTRVAVCRRCGEMVFARADGQPAPVSFQDADAAIMHVVGSSTVAEARTRIRARQSVLLSPTAAHALRFAVDQRARDEGEREVLAELGRLLDRCRDEGIDVVLGRADVSPQVASPPASAPTPSTSVPAPDPGHADVDQRFVGHWRHTEAMSSGGFSLVTDTHMVLDATGRFAWWTHSASGAMGESYSERDHGTWRVSGGGVLTLVFDDGTTQTRRSQVDGDTMLLPDETRYRLWNRVGR